MIMMCLPDLCLIAPKYVLSPKHGTLLGYVFPSFKWGKLAEQRNVYILKHNTAILALGKQLSYLSYLMQLHRMMGGK